MCEDGGMICIVFVAGLMRIFASCVCDAHVAVLCLHFFKFVAYCGLAGCTYAVCSMCNVMLEKSVLQGRLYLFCLCLCVYISLFKLSFHCFQFFCFFFRFITEEKNMWLIQAFFELIIFF